jgi:hypothetical protein
MWKYTGSGNIARSTGAEWYKKEYTTALKRIRMAQFSSLEEGLPPFAPDENAVPTVSRIHHELLSLLLR